MAGSPRNNDQWRPQPELGSGLGRHQVLVVRHSRVLCSPVLALNLNATVDCQRVALVALGNRDERRGPATRREVIAKAAECVDLELLWLRRHHGSVSPGGQHPQASEPGDLRVRYPKLCAIPPCSVANEWHCERFSSRSSRQPTRHSPSTYFEVRRISPFSPREQVFGAH